MMESQNTIKYKTLKLGLLTAGLTTISTLAQAVPVTLDFNSSATGCATGVSIFNAVSLEEGHCHDRNNGDFQSLRYGDTLVVAAEPGVTFDYLGADILYFWDEIFKLSVSDVPSGLDLTNPDDILYVNQNWLWQSSISEVPLISVKGYAGGTLVEEWFDLFPNTEVFNLANGIDPSSSSLDWDSRNFPGSPMTGLDRLEIGFGLQFADADVETPILIGDTWFGHLDGGDLNFDDLLLDVTVSDVTPVPVPMSAFLLLGGLFALGGFRRLPRQ